MSVVNADRTVTATTNFGSPGYDWMKLPGETMVQLPMSELKGHGDHSDRTFVGGADDTVGNGVFALDLGGPKTCGWRTSAQKTWFCFGDTVVCLGSGIRDSHAASKPTPPCSRILSGIRSGSNLPRRHPRNHCGAV